MSFLSCEEMLAAARSQKITLAEAVLRSDLEESRLTEEQSRAAMHHLWQVMQATSREYDPAQRSRSGLSGGDAAKVEQAHKEGKLLGGDYLSAVTAEALKTAECNACMKRIVAAPTAGSCGVLPAVLLPLARAGEADEEAVCEALYVAAGFGQVIAARATLAGAKDFDVSNVRDALSAFSRLISNTHKKVFDKVFDTLQTGLSKLGDSSGSQTKAISGLLTLIKDIPMDGKQDYDVLGFIYEYLISNFAANAGKKAGEFYTPHEVSLLMSEIVASHLKGKSEIKIYDPTSGSGSLLINIGQSVAKYMTDDNNIKYFAQELKENTYNLTRMNLVMRGIKPDNIVTRNGDTLEEDWPYFDENDPVNTYNPLYVDAVVSNPPYSQAWDPSNKEGDPRYARFGLAPKGKADYAFLLHDLFHIKPDGIMTIVLPHGVLFRGGEEGEIRKNLIENNHIDAIIGLPANIFFGTGIPTIIMVLRQKRENTDVLIIDASKGFIKEGKNNKLRASDIKRIA